MKKTLILLASAAMALVACTKEIVESPAVQHSEDGFTITAISPATKALVDGLQVNWTTGDQVALFQTSGDPELFTLLGEGPVVSGTFHSDVTTLSPNGLAAFPGVGASNDGMSKVSLAIPAEFEYGTTPIPMIGQATSATTFAFTLVTGAINIIVKDIPPYPTKLVVTADKNITGTLEIPVANPTAAAFAEEGAGKTFTITNIPKGNINITLPVPAGTYALDVKLLAADNITYVPRSNKSNSSVAVETGKICKLKTIDLEYGNPAAPYTGPDASAIQAWVYANMSRLPGKWNVYGGNSAKSTEPKWGIYVLGGGGGYDVSGGWAYPAFVCPVDKSYDWDTNLIWKETDNELVIKATGMSGNEITGTTNWWAGNDGQFWDYIWKYKASDKPQYDPFYNTDLSAYYDRIPKGEKAFTLDISDMSNLKLTLGNGEQPKLLVSGEYKFFGGIRKLIVPDDCFALMFHIGNMKPVINNSNWLNSGSPRDIDRFFFSPLEYIIIFERTGDLS